MQDHARTRFSGRERRRLERARENGYLDATCARNREIGEAHRLWCWRLRLPAVWFERRTPYSRYGRVHLDLFTTANVLTDNGQTAMKALGARLGISGMLTISSHDVCWDRVPLRRLGELAKAVFKTAVKAGNCQFNRSNSGNNTGRGPAKLVSISQLRAAASA
jgi:hypothetical protein